MNNKIIDDKLPPDSNMNFPLSGPGALALLSLLAGPMISGLVIGSTLIKLDRRKTGWLTALIMGLSGVALNIFLLLWTVKWYWAALTLAAIHIGSAALIFIIMRRLYLALPEKYNTRFASSLMQSKSYVSVGLISGTMMSLIFGGTATVFFLLGSDRLFSNFMPVAVTDGQSLSLLFFSLFALAVSGAITGGYLGRLRLKITPSRMIFYSLAFVAISISWLFALQITISIPGFQAGQAGDMQGSAIWFPYVTGNFLIGIWWTPFLFIYMIKPPTAAGKLLRMIQIPLIHLAAGMVLAVLFGFANNGFHAAGRYFERQAKVPLALWYYERGLKKNPDPFSASYLQYRVALLSHKLGDHDRALEGFRKVVSKYTANEELVKKSNRFLDSLARSDSKGKRVVLPGVETDTAHKGAYCVPNSLALVMGFWGSEVDALNIGRSITGLSKGTMIVDQAWFAEQEGFRHDFLPLASIDDIKSAIDAGFPVLVYVPAHVFAIVGYDDTLETFVTYDVATSDVWVDYIQKDFIKSWKKQTTTLVLVYPAAEEERVPDHIHTRLVQVSDNYLHYHLHYTEVPASFTGSKHLIKAAGEKEGFFLPLAILYKNFPGLRPLIASKYDENYVVGTIIDYFGNNFDEGVHLSGQFHYDEDFMEDPVLDYSLQYLIGQNQLSLADDLISRIEEHGPISDNTKKTRAMIDLARGNFESGVNRLTEVDDDNLAFYRASGNWMLGNEQSAVRDLVETVDGCT